MKEILFPPKKLHKVFQTKKKVITFIVLVLIVYLFHLFSLFIRNIIIMTTVFFLSLSLLCLFLRYLWIIFISIYIAKISVNFFLFVELLTFLYWKQRQTQYHFECGMFSWKKPRQFRFYSYVCTSWRLVLLFLLK